MLALAFTGCDGTSVNVEEAVKDILGGGKESGGADTVAVEFKELTQQGGGTEGEKTYPTTALTLVFDKAIDGLTADDLTLTDISGTGAEKRDLTGEGPTYTLAVSGIEKDGEVSVGVAKTGYTFTPASLSVPVVYGPGKPTPVTFTLEADGDSETETETTALTLTFDPPIPGLALVTGDEDGIKFNPGETGATVEKPATSDEGKTYTLAVSGITQPNTVSVTVKKLGYEFSGGSTKSVNVWPAPEEPGGGEEDDGTGALPPGPPTAGISEVQKTTPVDNTAVFTLTNDPPLADDSVWKVYTQESGGTPSATITASRSGNDLTLTHTSGILAGFYWVTVTENGESESARLKLLVYDTVEEIASYLGSGLNEDTVNLTLYLDLADETNGWDDLLYTVKEKNKKVALDLSACAMANAEDIMEFDPGTANTGESKIVSLVLPNAAQSIKAGTSYNTRTFQHFTSLKSIAGANITSVGSYAFYDSALTTVNLPAAASVGSCAFYGCTALTTVSLPLAASVGSYAFYYCTKLTTVNLPAATSIANMAFGECKALTTVSLPLAAGVGSYAFWNCTKLTTVSLPLAAGVDSYAFKGCNALTTVILPAATSIGNNAFSGCNALTKLSLPAAPPNLGSDVFWSTNSNGSTLTIKVPNVSAYTSAWGVSATTAAKGNESKYGKGHKKIVIQA